MTVEKFALGGDAELPFKLAPNVRLQGLPAGDDSSAEGIAEGFIHYLLATDEHG